MNYFEHHIRDYDTETAHLSWLEDMAYTRLIRYYYRKEQPIMADVAEACRKVRAVSKLERQAVQTVLNEFFELREDGWHQKTCDENIVHYLSGEPEREAKKANEENRTKRHRDERAALFKQLTAAGRHAPWNIGIKELRALVNPLQETETVTPVTQPVTAPATLVTATQSPITNHQSPVYKDMSATPDGAAQKDAPGGAAPKVTPSDEDFKAARWMFGQVLAVNPTAKPPSNWTGWATDVRLMRERDGRSHREICDLFQWAKHDSFWAPNIQSPAKLREKWDQLTEQRARPASGKTAPVPNQKFNFAGADRSGDQLAQAASMAKHGIVVPEGEVEL